MDLPARAPSLASRSASLRPIMPAPPMMRTFMLSPASTQRYAAGLGPAEAFNCRAARLVFAADPALVAARVDFFQQPRVVQVARIRLAAIGRVGDLVVTGEGRVLLHGDGHVAVLDLPVINVELKTKVGLRPPRR